MTHSQATQRTHTYSVAVLMVSASMLGTAEAAPVAVIVETNDGAAMIGREIEPNPELSALGQAITSKLYETISEEIERAREANPALSVIDHVAGLYKFNIYLRPAVTILSDLPMKPFAFSQFASHVLNDELAAPSFLQPPPFLREPVQTSARIYYGRREMALA